MNPYQVNITSLTGHYYKSPHGEFITIASDKLPF